MRSVIINWIVLTVLVVFANLKPIPDPSDEDEHPTRPLTDSRLTEFRRGILWPHTILLWLIQGKLDEFKRLGLFIWGVLTIDWLWLWIFDRIDPNWPFAGLIYLIILETVMSLVTICVHLLPWNRGHNEAKKILFRGLVWPLTLIRWFKSGNLEVVAEFIAGIWVVLTLCWMWGANADVWKDLTSLF